MHRTAKCSHGSEPVTLPTNVAAPITTASVAISASGGRPPPLRQAIPTSIAPAPIVTPATGSFAARPPPRTATTGIAASSPALTDTRSRSKRAAERTAADSTAGSDEAGLRGLILRTRDLVDRAAALDRLRPAGLRIATPRAPWRRGA